MLVTNGRCSWKKHSDEYAHEGCQAVHRHGCSVHSLLDSLQHHDFIVCGCYVSQYFRDSFRVTLTGFLDCHGSGAIVSQTNPVPVVLAESLGTEQIF